MINVVSKLGVVIGALIATLPFRTQAQLAPAQHVEQLGPPPTAPLVAKSTFGLATTQGGQPAFGTNFFNTFSRENSRQFYNLVFTASENVPMGWSGTYSTCTPGTNAPDYLQAVQRRVNYFRAMAGIPATITFSNEYSRKAQHAALIMGANNALSHFPPPTWTCYTPDGDQGAQNSNISLGNAGPQAVASQMRDNGANNAAVGHRRWILYPQTRFMGAGNVPATNGNAAANALWVLDPFYGTQRPSTRFSSVAWPPPGFVPYQVVYARWSFSYPNADFSLATVAMTSNGVPWAVSLEPLQCCIGEDTLVWVPSGLNPNTLTSFPRPASDTVYRITVSNVRIGGVPRSFIYDVAVFDPAVPGNDFFPPTISGSSQPLIGATNIYSFTAVSNANGYEWRQSRLANVVFMDGAESGLGNFTVQASTGQYNVQDSSVRFAGTYSFHLAHPAPPTSQILTLNRSLLAGASSTVQCRSRLGWAAPDQRAKIQVSTDGGNSWNDVYTQAGSDGPGETTFALRSVSLGAYAGRTLQLRFNYEFISGSYYPQTSSGVGWYLDDITLQNFQETLSSSVASANTNQTFGFGPSSGGMYLLEVRPILFGNYPSEWGPSLAVNAVPGVRITSIQRSAGNTWHINFSLLGGSPAGFELWSSGTVDGTFTRELGATVQTVVPGSQYRAVLTSAGPQRFFLIKVL